MNDQAPPAERHSEGDPPKKKKRRRNRNRDGGGGAPKKRAAPRDRAARILFELRDLVRDLAAEHGAGPKEKFPVEALELRLSVPLDGYAPAAVRHQAKALVEAVRGRMGEIVRGATAFHQGHVYCFYSDAPESRYSQPPAVTDVFAGYAANGKPEWRSFANLCLERGEPRVDRLYGDPPETLAVVQTAEELTGELLPGFGRDSLAYSVLGQVTCGLVPRDLNPKAGRDVERVALTLQIVETRQGTRGHRLRFNVLGLPSDEILIAAAEADERSAAEAFRRILRTSRQRVDALGRQIALAARQGQPLDREPLVSQILGRLRSDILRVFRNRAYRTNHAEQRHKSGDRPTGVALKDAQAVADGRLLYDTHRETLVVVGPRGRAHVFTHAGKHVTSLQLDPGELERKLERKRWRTVNRHATHEFRAALDPGDGEA